MRAAGFTLVELVTVMMVMGILAIGTVRFISDSSMGFASTITRTELAGDARFAIDRIARELRSALPGSVRASSSCLELIPVVAGSTYSNLPIAVSATSFSAVPVEPMPLSAGLRVAVYPGPAAYLLSTVSVISPEVVVSIPDVDNEVTVSMASAHRFPAESPSNRFFLVEQPVSFCIAGEQLWRYSNYGFSVAQPDVASLPVGLPGRSLIAQRVTSAAPFSVNAATLARNAVIDIKFDFARGDDVVSMQHLVQVRNVP